MNQPRRCPACGSMLPENRLSGLCPACTWKGLSEPDDDGAPMVSALSESLMRVAGHEIAAEIARGGMGIVYRARQFDPPRTVALKMLLPHQLGSAEMAERFRIEVSTLTLLEHPAILPVYQVGEHERLPFFTMKLATGGTLAHRKNEFTGKWRAVAELVATLADAVQFAHERGVLHRDLKPGNILFDEQGRPYVSDFGLAKVVSAESDLTRSMDFLGTPNYVAPEVAARSAQQATTASDIYSLGAILYELLAGHPPFEAEGIPALLKKIAEDPPAKLPAPVPRDLQIICLKCLSKEPAGRYASARELASDLRRWLAGQTILARSATSLERMRAWARRNPALATATALLVLLFTAAALLEMRANRRLKDALNESLLAQAQLRRSSGRAGQRFETITLVERAAKDQPRDASSQKRLASLRTELAAALALPDVRLKARWPVHISNLENDFDFTANLDRYVTASPGGGFAIFSTVTRQPIWQRSGASNNPAVEMRLSPDGRWVAARFQDGSGELHATFTNASPQHWPSRAPVPFPFAFDSSGNQFALSSRDPAFIHGIQVLNLTDGTIRTMVPHKVPPPAFTFDARGELLAVAADTLEVWRLADTSLLWSVSLAHNPSAVAWSPEGRRLAVALDRRLPKQGGEPLKADPVLIFDAATGRQEFVFAEAGARVERLSFSPDGKSLAAATWAGELILGSTQPSGLRLATEGMQRALTFSSDGKWLGYAPTREELGLLEVATPSVVQEWESDGPLATESFAMAVSANGQWVLTGTGSGVQLWDAKTRTQVASLPLPAKAWWLSVLFGPGDQSIYYSAVSFGVRRVQLVETNAPDGTARLQFGRSESLDEGQFIAIGFAADGRSLIVGQNRRRSPNERIPPTMWLWPDGDPNRARKLIEDFPVVGYREMAGGRWGITTDLIDPDLWIWDARTVKRVRNLGIPLPTSSEPAPNGRWLVTRTRREFVVWEAESWRALSRWPVTGSEQVSGWLVISPDSRLLATATTDGQITLRNMPSGVELMRLTPPSPVRLSDWRFAPDCQRLYVLTITGRVFDWNLSELRHELAKLKLDW